MMRFSPSHAAAHAAETIRVLFDCPGAWPVLDPEASGGIGGAEVRAVTFARGLTRLGGFDVQFVVRGDGPTSAHCIDGVTVHFEGVDSLASPRVLPWVEGTLRLSRRLAGSVAQRLAGIPARQAFIETLDYHVLACFGVTNRTASLVRSAHCAGRQAIVFLTSDRSLDDIRLQGRRQRGVYGELGFLCRYALQSADAVVVQKRSQQTELLTRLGIQSQLIRNPIELQGDETTPPNAPSPLLHSPPYVLWVGRADTFSKRPDRCWQLARQCPTIPFMAIMNRHDATTFAHLQSTRPPNVRVIEHVPLTKIEPYFRQARLLINTSDAEGFPNAFLQAGKYGVPIVSLKEDPDGMLHRHGGGICCHGNLENMRHWVEQLFRKGVDYTLMSRKVYEYTRQYHGAEQRCEELANLLRTVNPRRAAA
jgi:glycosyltransferase involved in cell wall biosynthesis